MTELSFAVAGARPDATALTPVLNLLLRIRVGDAVEVQSITMRCQIRVEPDQRRYRDAEQDQLHDLFGEPSRWSDTLRPFLLTHVTLPVGGFTGTHEVNLPVELSYDLEVAAGKYLHALQDGEVPLLFLFSGTVFLRDGGGIQAMPIPWDLEARYRMPVSVWDELMDLHFPDSGWLRVRRDILDTLQAYKSRHALSTWDATLEHLLADRRART